MPPPATSANVSSRASAEVTWDDDAYAGPLRRAGAAAIDIVVVTTLLTLLGPLVGAGDLDPAAVQASAPPLSLQLLALVLVLYDVVLTSQLGWTLGKRALGIEVRTSGGQLPWAGLAVGRFFCRYVSALPLLLGFLWAAFDPRRQTWHDKLCRTYVLTSAKVRPREPTSAGEAESDRAGAPTGAGGQAVAGGVQPRPQADDTDLNRAAVAAAGLSPAERAWLEEVAAQVDERLERVAPGWREQPSAPVARATAFGVLLGHLARRHPGHRPQLSRVAEAHLSFATLLAGSRLSTLEEIAGDPELVASWLGPLVDERRPEVLERLFD